MLFKMNHELDPLPKTIAVFVKGYKIVQLFILCQPSEKARLCITLIHA